MYSTVLGLEPARRRICSRRRAAPGFPTGRRPGFEIVRKGEEQLLADRRIVWDNDQQPKELAGEGAAAVVSRARRRETGERLERRRRRSSPRAFRHDKPRARLDPLPPPRDAVANYGRATGWTTLAARPTSTALASQPPTFIDNFLGYNAGRDLDPPTGRVESRDRAGQDKHWVGDLILECEADIRRRARGRCSNCRRASTASRPTFADGKVTLAAIGAGRRRVRRPVAAVQGRPRATHKLRFANVDCRLWVWVDGKRDRLRHRGRLPPPTPEQEAAFKDADGQPGREPRGLDAGRTTSLPRRASGRRGGVDVQDIKLHRDIYYTAAEPSPTDHARRTSSTSSPATTCAWATTAPRAPTAASGALVPERLMLGKAVFVFFPRGRRTASGSSSESVVSA